MRFQALVIPVLLFFSIQTLAASNPDPTLRQLSQSKTWLHLLHYHRVGLFSQFESQIDDPSFFISPSGKDNPHQELIASIHVFFEQNDRDFICRYPARYQWLIEQIPEHAKTTIDWQASCPEFHTWFNKISPESLSIIFPAAYLNSPSSMFGHTLIRINSTVRNNPLLDYSVNYAANANPEDNELVFSFKGLTGGYPGVVSILPYYEKVKEYSFLEARDVWEYELILNQDEVEQFVRHVWEVKDVYIDYYFFTENCSYLLLTLLDASSDRLSLSEHFYESAIPADTVRVLAEQDLIDEHAFRPSNLTQMQHMLREVSRGQAATARKLVDERKVNFELESYAPREQAQILELAYQYARYLGAKKKQQSDALKRTSLALLSARSKLKETDVFYSVSDDSGHVAFSDRHRSRRFSLAWDEALTGPGRSDRFVLGMRMAYHDLLDPIGGYLKASRLEMFNLELSGRQSSELESARLESLELINILSLSSRSRFITPTSWTVSTGWQRRTLLQSELTAFLNTAFGHAYQVSENWVVFGLVGFDLDAANDIGKGFRWGGFPQLGMVQQGSLVSSTLTFRHSSDLLNGRRNFVEFDAGFSVTLDPQYQIRFEFSHHREEGHSSRSKLSSEFNYYF